MQKRVLLLHGWGGSDNPHWQAWLAAEIAKEYGCVNFLHFTNIDEPKLDVWMNELQKTLTTFKPDIVVCHSLANTLWFHLCNNNPEILIEKLYLVAPPSLNCSVEELNEFFPVKLPSNLCTKEATLVTSTNDPYLTQEEAKSFKRTLDIPHKVLLNAGHINADSGYGAWEWILQEVNL